MNKKLTYTAPEAESFVVGFEGCVCTSDPVNPETLSVIGVFGLDGAAGGDFIVDQGFNL